MYGPVTSDSSMADGEINPGDILRSEYGRTVRTVLAVEDDNVILRTPRGAADAIKLDAAKRFWRKIGTEAK